LPKALRHSLAFSYSFIALKFAVAFVIAALSYNFFEKKFLALKDRFAPVCQEAQKREAVSLTAGSGTAIGVRGVASRLG
jgi:peptidoglycan/LPS O-acetylase OafA/YrhL